MHVDFGKDNDLPFLTLRVCHPNANSYQDLEPRQSYELHENEKKRLCGDRVIEVCTTGLHHNLRYEKNCNRYHGRLTELMSTRKGESCAKTISWIRAEMSFVLLRSALLCLRGSRTIKRVTCDIKNTDIDIQTTESAMSIELNTYIL